MRTALKIAFAVGLVTLLCGIVVWKGFPAVQASSAVQAQTPVPTVQAPGKHEHKAVQAFGVLIKATADASGLKAHDVLTQLRSGQSLADIAAAHNSSGDKVVQAATAKLKARLDKAVASGKLTQDQENQRLAKFTTAATQAVNDKQLAQKIAHRTRAAGGQALIAITATLTGQTHEQIMTDLKAGKSLADIAAAHGSNGDKVVQAALDKVKARLDQAVSKGHITQAQADERLAKLHTKITAAVGRPGLHTKTGDE